MLPGLVVLLSITLYLGIAAALELSSRRWR